MCGFRLYLFELVGVAIVFVRFGHSGKFSGFVQSHMCQAHIAVHVGRDNASWLDYGQVS